MTIAEYIKSKLEKDYLGKKINNSLNTCEFVVSSISVEDGGVDPQWEIMLEGKSNNEVYSMNFCDNKMPEIRL